MKKINLKNLNYKFSIKNTILPDEMIELFQGDATSFEMKLVKAYQWIEPLKDAVSYLGLLKFENESTAIVFDYIMQGQVMDIQMIKFYKNLKEDCERIEYIVTGMNYNFDYNLHPVEDNRDFATKVDLYLLNETELINAFVEYKENVAVLFMIGSEPQ